jgi:preprotein translocase subunit SecA
MESKKIFEYSNDFLNEIIKDLIRLKHIKKSNPKNIEFDKKLKSVLGKNFEENEFANLVSSNDDIFKEKIYQKFSETRDQRIKILGEDQSKDIEKRIFLQSIDINWKSHIQYLEQLRQVIGLRSYGQRDPLIEYKKEAFDLFENLLNKLKLDFITILMNLKVIESQPKEKINNDVGERNLNKINQKVSRNEPCPCGSGKKYKRCCGTL